MITGERIMVGAPMALSTMTTPTKQSTTMSKTNTMTQRTTVKPIPISKKLTTKPETEARRTTRLKGTQLEMMTKIESKQNEGEAMMAEIEVLGLLEAGAEEIKEAEAVAMIVISEGEEGAIMEVMLTTTIETSKQKK